MDAPMIALISFLVALPFAAFVLAAIISAKLDDKKKADAEKAEKERWEKLSPEEQKKEIEMKEEEKRKKRLEYLSKALYNYSPPYWCPSCHSENYILTGKYTYPDHTSRWILDSSDTIEEEKFDGATRIYGSTTIYTKTVQRTVNTYRCPHCGYRYRK